MVQVALTQSTHNMPILAAKDVIVSHDASPDAIKNYIEKLMAIVSAASQSVHDSKETADVVMDFIKDPNNTIAIQELTQRVDASDIFLTKVQKLPVPEDFVALHLNFLNTSIRESESVKKIQNIKNDAMLAIVGVREFVQAETQFQNIIMQYRQLLKDKNVSIATP